MKEPLISVIICVYNGEAYLSEAIECVHQQDYSNIELIVVNDGSTDATPEIAKSHRQAKLISHEINRGLPAARNTGIQAAKGDYIAFLDADDLWMPNKISTQVRFHQENQDYKYSFTRERFFFEDGAEQPNWTKKPVFQEDHIAYCAGSMLFDAVLFKTVGQFNPEFRNGDTTEWIFRAKDQGYLGGRIEEVLLLRRIHKNNLSSLIKEENKSLLKAVKASINRQIKLND
jgi:glycosyltransferase involved in cell wall biosynthesis